MRLATLAIHNRSVTATLKLMRRIALAGATVTSAATLVALTPAVSTATPGGGPTVTTTCTPNGYEDETFIDDSGYSGLLPTHDYQTYFTENVSGYTFDDGGFVTDASGNGTSGKYIAAVPSGTGFTWVLRSGATDIADGSGAAGGPVCTPHAKPQAPELGSASNMPTNGGAVTVSLDVTDGSSGSLKVLQGNAVIMHGEYSTPAGDASQVEAAKVKLQLSKAQMRHLWWVQSWSLPAKITSKNTYGQATTSTTIEFVEPAQFDPVKISKTAITAAKTRKYKVAITGDPSLTGSIKVKLGAKRLNDAGDLQIGKNGRLTKTFTLSSAAWKHLKQVKSEKVSIAATFAKGPAKPVSDTVKVKLKAPKKG